MVYADYFCALCRIFNLYVSFLFLYFVSKLKNMGKKKEIQINDLTVDELKKLIGEVLNSYFGNMKSSSTVFRTP